MLRAPDRGAGDGGEGRAQRDGMGDERLRGAVLRAGKAGVWEGDTCGFMFFYSVVKEGGEWLTILGEGDPSDAQGYRVQLSGRRTELGSLGSV